MYTPPIRDTDNIFYFAGDSWCAACAEEIKNDLRHDGVEDNGDSCTYPQGPYYADFIETEYPDYCAGCEEQLGGKVLRWKLK